MSRRARALSAPSACNALSSLSSLLPQLARLSVNHVPEHAFYQVHAESIETNGGGTSNGAETATNGGGGRVTAGVEVWRMVEGQKIVTFNHDAKTDSKKYLLEESWALQIAIKMNTEWIGYYSLTGNIHIDYFCAFVPSHSPSTGKQDPWDKNKRGYHDPHWRRPDWPSAKHATLKEARQAFADQIDAGLVRWLQSPSRITAVKEDATRIRDSIVEILKKETHDDTTVDAEGMRHINTLIKTNSSATAVWTSQIFSAPHVDLAPGMYTVHSNPKIYASMCAPASRRRVDTPAAIFRIIHSCTHSPCCSIRVLSRIVGKRASYSSRISHVQSTETSSKQKIGRMVDTNRRRMDSRRRSEVATQL